MRKNQDVSDAILGQDKPRKLNPSHVIECGEHAYLFDAVGLGAQRALKVSIAGHRGAIISVRRKDSRFGDTTSQGGIFEA